MITRTIEPLLRPLDARLELPGSKSYANRALVCAALAGTPRTIANISPGDDTALMLNVLGDLGWTITRPNPLSRDVRLAPPGPRKAPGGRVYAGAAGTVARFACALLCAVPGRFELDGNARMRQRPMADLIAALRGLGAKITELGQPGCLPVSIEGASLRGGEVTLPGGVSSQFLSALLMIAPALAKPAVIHIAGDLVSKPYVGITLEVMLAFGLPPSCVRRAGWTEFHVMPHPYAPAGDYHCPPDGTAAGYFWGAAAITGGRCVVDGLARTSPQGDVRFVDILARMGCTVLEPGGGLGVQGPRGGLKPVRANLSDLPDCAQTLAVVAAFAEGESRLDGLSTLRHKETDRVAALVTELAKLGIAARAEGDSLLVRGGKPRATGEIATYDDHRMAMSFAMAGLAIPGVRIQNPDVVSKSFPAFWDYLAGLGSTSG
ncbi:MAG: 3-phosphoshikimate 1-carboxyvinyltransferase [Planctomycetes bacterium]|jgi:3-phosphoshikimate 1-carboxyvinyltransferase|nr:3-phosphoshikimate 1-carboxyvinyltransferase [Planctomycetota bacterium]MCL4731126.1 3-phosphoshikimate 1-carboxyvinyltransferase [Planctomycetota bacterium]